MRPQVIEELVAHLAPARIGPEVHTLERIFANIVELAFAARVTRHPRSAIPHGPIEGEVTTDAIASVVRRAQHPIAIDASEVHSTVLELAVERREHALTARASSEGKRCALH